MTPLLMALVASGLVLRIESPQAQVLVGEPFKVTVRWQAGPRGVYVRPQPQEFGDHSLAFYVHDGRSERLYVEARRDDSIAGPYQMAPGEEMVTNLVLLRGGYAPDMHTPAAPGLLFERAGDYRLRVECLGSGTGSGKADGAGVSSNRIRIRVTEPRGPDLEVLKLSERNRLVLDATPSSPGETEALVARYPTSPYLEWARLRLLHFKEARGAGGENPEALRALQQTDPAEHKRRVRTFYLDLAREVLAQEWGPFEEDAIAQAHVFAQKAGDEGLMREMGERLRAKYPRSTYSKKLRAAERSLR